MAVTADANRFLDALRERLAEFALSLHPEKTRLIEFGRYAAQNRKRRGLGKPETFNFLGFIFICGKSTLRLDRDGQVYHSQTPLRKKGSRQSRRRMQMNESEH